MQTIFSRRGNRNANEGQSKFYWIGWGTRFKVGINKEQEDQVSRTEDGNWSIYCTMFSQL